MLNVLNKWYERNFRDEEAVILLLILLAGVAMVLLLGEILAPVIAALVLAFLLQGVVTQLLDWRFPHLAAVTASSALLVFLLLLILGLLLPLAMQQLANLLQELPALLVVVQEQWPPTPCPPPLDDAWLRPRTRRCHGNLPNCRPILRYMTVRQRGRPPPPPPPRQRPRRRW